MMSQVRAGQVLSFQSSLSCVSLHGCGCCEGYETNYATVCYTDCDEDTCYGI